MTAPFRIRSRSRTQRSASPGAGAPPADGLADYAERLSKLVPAEVISLYLAGVGVIGAPQSSPQLSVAWVGVCLVGVVAVRVWGTRESGPGSRPQWPAVAIAAVSFLIWVYQLGGGPFALASLYDPKAAALLLLVWTFFVPLFYRGDAAPVSAAPPSGAGTRVTQGMP
ncbi:MAG TPA: hypothetical protein VMR50_07400 [Myxococcota bacterium]|nr:hypothetical protein [Myxococcota bacterium]